MSEREKLQPIVEEYFRRHPAEQRFGIPDDPSGNHFREALNWILNSYLMTHKPSDNDWRFMRVEVRKVVEVLVAEFCRVETRAIDG